MFIRSRKAITYRTNRKGKRRRAIRCPGAPADLGVRGGRIGMLSFQGKRQWVRPASVSLVGPYFEL